MPESKPFEPIRLLTKKQVAAALSVTTVTIDRWVRAGKFPQPARVFGYPRWKPEDVSKYVEERFKEARN